jgi:hypothetical protein
MKSEGNAFSEQGVSSYSRPLLSGKNVTAMDRWLATKLMEVVGNPPIRIVLWNDQAVLAPKEAIATMHFHDPTKQCWPPRRPSPPCTSTTAVPCIN